ncbi:ABC transporter ATP-binding protein [Frankia sp. BMG5.23]|uniref:ABC transporter ATP-binding protein n=1 Tax=Frankia sp. BMG5.23 TaxID=683305 RepID=UPI0004620028|nr:ABC transporter ATP-binding protein [Frankia sp. BMG5.23]KDA42495.1 carbohydrate ABC transporter ATP-binding protein, CUT1 family [Frankia sp. BMG5.23]
MTDTTVTSRPILGEAPPPELPAPSGGVHFRGIMRRYGGTGRPALDVADLHLPHRSFTVIVGPSGCGKSTALRVITGLETPDEGRLTINGVDVTATPPGARGVSMVFQDFALYPHLTVEQNIAFSLRLEAKHNRGRLGLLRRGAGGAGPSRGEISRRVTEACVLLGLADLRHRRPGQLSGGERQRVGLARAIVRRPSVLLLDEPLSALDAQLRQQARAELVRLHRELGNTVVLVTHDQLEALSMGTHLVVMNGGRVAQAGTPEQVYRRPADVFVAAFVGSPAMNLHLVEVTNGGGALAAPGLSARLAGPLTLPRAWLGWRPGDGVIEAGPDRAAAAGGLAGAGLVMEGLVDVVEFTGDVVVVHCVSGAAAAGETGEWDAGPDEVGPARWAVTVPAQAGVPDVGTPLRVRVPARRLHLFDPVSGQRVDEIDDDADDLAVADEPT